MMKDRIWALTQVGKWVGVDEMINQIKQDEVIAIYEWFKPAFANTRGLSQIIEMDCNERYSEIVCIGNKEVTKALYEYCREKVIE